MAACRAAAGESFEILLVNDGSRDGTWAKMCEIAERTPGVVGVGLSRNYGHQLAASAGLQLARGERVVLIDADLQDPPELIGPMMQRMDEGFDVVYARRRKRANESAFKLATAGAFYRLLASLSDRPDPHRYGRLPPDVAPDRRSAQRHAGAGSLHPRHGGLAGRPADRDALRPRRTLRGETSYTLPKMIALATAGITSFSTAPLKLAVYLAGAGAIVALALMFYTVIGFMAGHTTPAGPASD